MTHHKTITVGRNADLIINERINVLHCSMKGILMLFCETHAGGARDSKKFFNPDITSVKVTINGIPNKVYSQGLETRDTWDEVNRHFGKHAESNMDATKFYTEDKFGFCIDLRSMADHYLHGSGLKLVNTKDGVQRGIERKKSGSGSVKCHIYIISDAQFEIQDKELKSVQYKND